MKTDRNRVAAHVAPGRCTSCGHKTAVWTPARIVEAFHLHVEKHGRVPTAIDWAAGTVDHPAQTTVCTMFGTWNRGINAAGLSDREAFEREPVYTKQMVVDAMLDHLAREGRWPTWRDWAKAKGRRNRERPASWTVVRLFGSWRAGIDYASGKTDPQFRSVTVYRDPTGCVGCGCDIDSYEAGCGRCRDRRLRRASRSRAKSGLGMVESALPLIPVSGPRRNTQTQTAALAAGGKAR